MSKDKTPAQLAKEKKEKKRKAALRDKGSKEYKAEQARLKEVNPPKITRIRSTYHDEAKIRATNKKIYGYSLSMQDYIACLIYLDRKNAVLWDKLKFDELYD